ncbi:hypothetical protein QQF64_025903 [Cirrhinus molitorella]|uniref:Uncharacterized protein n=1 Tax=Cirrhinus molitorella TaxID=172907 RepID=A0ABR3NQS0_9TELE
MMSPPLLIPTPTAHNDSNCSHGERIKKERAADAVQLKERRGWDRRGRCCRRVSISSWRRLEEPVTMGTLEDIMRNSRSAALSPCLHTDSTDKLTCFTTPTP